MSFVTVPVAGPAPRVDVARSHADRRAVAAAIAWAGICALIIVAPFEARRPILDLSGQSFSGVEAVLLVSLAIWGLSLAGSRTWPTWRTGLTLPWIVLIAVMGAAAYGAPEHSPNAVRMVGRLVLAFAVYILTVSAINSKRRMVRTLVIAAGAAVAIWPLIVLEYAEVPAVGEFLTAFRPQTANVGGQVRAGGPFPYPTIASMYLEILFALVLALLLIGMDAKRYGRAMAAGVLLVAIGQAITLTYTRAGFGTMLAALLVFAVFRFRRRGFDPGLKALVAIGVLILIQLPGTRSFESLGLRFISEGQAGWYRASFDVPVSVSIPTGGAISVPIHVTNTGRSTWNPLDAPRFRLSYHWLLEDNRVVSWQGLRTDFPNLVPPGDGVLLNARVEAPMKPGRYRLMWDIEREDWLWFSSEPGAALFVTNATVSGPEIGPIGAPADVPLPAAANRPGRLLLWRAALGMFFAHPITGVGPDNFRLTYGRYVGLVNFDDRVHSNNMYLEALAGGGLLGAVAFAWLCWAAARQVAGALRTAVDPQMATVVVGVLAASVGIALHGLVDSFLSFTATYVLIAVTLGMASASHAINQAHAHRI